MPVDTHELELQRYWWLKRLAATAAVLFVLLILAWLLWYWHANRQMARLVAELKSAGQPVSVDDLKLPPTSSLAGDQPLLTQAVAQLTGVPTPTSSSLIYGDELPYPLAWHEMMEKAFAAHTPVYPLVRKARMAGEGDWQPQPSSAAALRGAAFAGLGSLRGLANLLGDTALYHHFKGNDQEALETILDCQHLTRAAGGRGFGASAIVAISIDALAADRLQVIATGLQIPSGATGDTLRAKVQQMITELSGDGEAAIWYREVFATENLVIIESGPVAPGLYVLAPLHRLQNITVMQDFRAASSALEQPNLPAAKATLASLRPPQAPVSLVDRPITTSDPLRYVYGDMAERRAAAISLAAALYRHDHGRYPESLSELVPMYLPHVPIDPMATGATPFTYLLAAQGARPVLICAGDDGIVQTKDGSYLPSRACYGWQNTATNRCDDQYRDLSAWKDPTPPAEPQ